MRAEGCSYIVFAALFAAIGAAFVVSGARLGPADHPAAQAFRTDPSCATAALTASSPSPGACTVVNATLVAAGIRVRYAGLSRTPTRTPWAMLRFPDRTSHDVELQGGAGSVFAESVTAGAPARVQLYASTIARVASGGNAAETIDAPDVNAQTDSEMPWVGLAFLAGSALCVWGSVRTTRRQAPKP